MAIDLIIFSIENQMFGFDLALVERVILAVEVTPFPHAPASILGVINLHGQVIPVINMRKIFNIEEREIQPEDQFIICQIHGKPAAIWIDRVKFVIDAYKKSTSEELNPALPSKMIDHVVKYEDEIIFLFKPDYILQATDIHSVSPSVMHE